MKTAEVIYGDDVIKFNIVYRPEKSKNISIHVYPNEMVQVDSPESAVLPDIKKAVLKRARWILKNVQQAKSQREHVLHREYVSGESHFYMGRRYKLKIIKVSKMEPSVKLYRGCIEIRAKDKSTSSIKKQLSEWYRERASMVFDKRVNILSEKIPWMKTTPSWKLISMRKQWGSCSPKGVLSLNPHLIKAPRECIDYVITHEMCHLKEHNHSPQYYRLLSQSMNGWDAVKAKLDGMSELLLNT